MLTHTIQRLQYLCDTIPPILSTISEDFFNLKSSPEKWSKKEILGHLIDSATNNHQRFVRVQFEEVPKIIYNQDNWNSYSYHNSMTTSHLISFWRHYNLHLIELLKLIPAEKLSRLCEIGSEKHVTLEWLIHDYVTHLEHHLRQLVEYK